MARMAVSKTVDLGSSPGVPANRSVAELVDAPVSKSGARKGVRVRVSPERLLLRSGENGRRSPVTDGPFQLSRSRRAGPNPACAAIKDTNSKNRFLFRLGNNSLSIERRHLPEVKQNGILLWRVSSNW